MSTAPKGFEVYETVGFRFVNFDFGGVNDFATAEQLVAEGKRRWALRLGGVLSLVPPDCVLRENEHFLEKTPDGHYRTV